MEVVKIVYVSAIIFPFLATGCIMIFVAHAMRKRKTEQDKLRESKELNNILEDVIESQDKNLDLYRSTIKDYRETFGKI